MNPYSSKIAIGDAHSKLILVGEHAVVYGKPAIAIPFPLKVRSIVEESVGPIMFESNIYTGDIYNMPMRLQGISDCIKETLNYLNKPFKGIRIRVDSSIPIGRGLGSSAAIAISIVRSLFSFYGQKPSENELFSFVQIAETHAHGNPSGLDMVAESSEYPIWFEKGKKALPLTIGKPLCMVVADTGRTSDTKTAVENVKKKYFLEGKKVKQSLDKIEEIANDTKAALIGGDINLLGKLLNCNHKELINIGVSDESLNNLVEIAQNTGALGAKLTGGGMGGCMIALASNLEKAKLISEELVKYGATKSWYFSTHNDTLYISKGNRR